MGEMPRDLSEEAVARWLHDDYEASARVVGWETQESCRVPWADLPAANQAVMLLTARAVRALVEREVAKERALTREKVREAVVRTNADARDGKWIIADEVVSRVLGDHPAGGHDEGRPARGEAPRG